MLRIDRERGAVTYNGKTAKLTAREAEIFILLIQHRNRNVQRAFIYEYLYGDDDTPRDGIIEVMIHRIRRKIQKIGLRVLTVWGFGYSIELPDDVKVEFKKVVTL